MIVKMIQVLGKRMETMQEMFTRDLEELKSKKKKKKKKQRWTISSRITEVEKWISDLEDRMVEMVQNRI